MSTIKKMIFTLSLVSISLLSSCKKSAGEGGNSTITGKIMVEEWNATFDVHISDHPGADVDIYIIYGDDATYGNKIKSGPDGIFEFKYLRKGMYTLYAYSKDATPAGKNAKKVNVEITKKKQTVDASTITIVN